MFKNNLLSAFRNLKKNKGFALINVLGLAIGLATCLLITLYVTDELSYDRYNRQAENIYRVTVHVRLNGNENTYAMTEKPLPDVIKDFPEITKMTRIVSKESLFKTPKKFYVKKDNINIEENRFAFSESSLFEVFTLPVVAGSTAHALDEPNSAVITESTAKKYFGNINVVGKSLTVNDTNFYKVTAVIKDISSRSHFNFDFILSYNSIPEYQDNGWGYSGINNYVLLRPGSNTTELEKKIRAVAVPHYPSSVVEGGNFLNYELTPLRKIHLYSQAQFELLPPGNIQYVYIFSVIAAFILLIACVNFMNLSTARSASRAKEVGVRKVLGSARKYLVAQFLTESMIVVFAAAVIAIVFTYLSIPLFNNIAAKQLHLGVDSLTWLVPSMVGVVLVVGSLAGSYPALYLSSFRPVSVLKGKLTQGFKAGFFRSFLVVFQFSISIFLIIGTIVIFKQLNYIHNRDLGYDRSHVMVIKNTNVLGKQSAAFRQEIKQLPGVINATLATHIPTGEERNVTGMFPQLPLDIKQDVLSELWPVDEDYIGTMGIQLIAGRNFSVNIPTDKTGLIVNEAFVKRFGFKDPLNKSIYRNSVGLETFHIVGVMRDFNFSSLRNNITPVALVYANEGNALNLRVKTTELPALIKSIQGKWQIFSSSQAFSYAFMDQQFDATYKSEQRIGELFISFSTIAILIACLGLFGLSAYAAEQRSKEIGIRKVLGANVSGIVAMLATDFIKLVLISIVIGSPVAWYAMKKWLQDFAYRTDMPVWVIPVAGGIALLIAFSTISFQSYKAASANPVKALKAE